jgi:chromosome segregation and condensation protein ScpB
VNAYKADRDAERAYHLERVTSSFKMVISAENAELLTELLGDDGGEQQDVA